MELQKDAALDSLTVGSLRVELSLDGAGHPRVTPIWNGNKTINWQAQGWTLSPVVSVNGIYYGLAQGNMTFDGWKPRAHGGWVLTDRCKNGLLVHVELWTARDNPVIWSTVTLENSTDETLEGIERFDALTVELGTEGTLPSVNYVLGWLDGPRLETPGHHAVRFPYPSWIPRLLYGDPLPELPPAPEAGWQSPVLRPVFERLETLPLRSGKRSTYENHPWAAVLDPVRQAGFFAGILYSGQWGLDVRYDRAVSHVTVNAYSMGNVHTLLPGQRIISPPAFLGFFEGGWDEAHQASARFTGSEIVRKPPAVFPLTYFNFGTAHLLGDYSDPLTFYDKVLTNVDAAAEAGFECFMIDAGWWDGSAWVGDFSIGLGNFTEHPGKFPKGLKHLSDYVHARGMLFGLWVEFERVDLRTANLGPCPWKPEWIVHQKGYAYRSWGQHFYDLCLGVPEAADWALENICAAIDRYGVDWLKYDSNEWSVCDDATHGHGEKDGEWFQIEGMNHVMRNVAERYPQLIIENCSGGSQRADLGTARYCTYFACHDTNWPSALTRRYAHGAGCIYPQYYNKQMTGYQVEFPYLNRPQIQGETPPGSQERLEWRAMSRMLGLFETGNWVGKMNRVELKRLSPIIAFYKTIRHALFGKRYVLRGTDPVIERDNLESDNWEAYEYIAAGEEMVCVYFFRCASPDDRFPIRLKGLQPEASYRIRYFRNPQADVFTGTTLMQQGIVLRLEQPLSSDILVLERVGSG